MDLDTFEAAFDSSLTPSPGSAPDRDAWPRLRRKLHGPTWRLAWTVTVIALGVLAGLTTTSPVGFLVAAGLVLSVLPGRLAKVRGRRGALAAVESPDDLRAIFVEETRKARASAFTGFLVYGVLGLSFLVTGLVAWLVGKSPAPGLAAGACVLVWSAVLLLVVLPRASREAALFSKDAGADGRDDA